MRKISHTLIDHEGKYLMKTFTTRKYRITSIALVIVSLFILTGCASLAPSSEYTVADSNTRQLKTVENSTTKQLQPAEGEEYPSSNHWHVPETPVIE